jgi:hypothetical protein
MDPSRMKKRTKQGIGFILGAVVTFGAFLLTALAAILIGSDEALEARPYAIVAGILALASLILLSTGIGWLLSRSPANDEDKGRTHPCSPRRFARRSPRMPSDV